MPFCTRITRFSPTTYLSKATVLLTVCRGGVPYSCTWVAQTSSRISHPLALYFSRSTLLGMLFIVVLGSASKNSDKTTCRPRFTCGCLCVAYNLLTKAPRTELKGYVQGNTHQTSTQQFSVFWTTTGTLGALDNLSEAFGPCPQHKNLKVY